MNNGMALALAITSAFKEQNLTDAFDAIVAAYYEEYTDAVEMDGTTRNCLQHLFDFCFPMGEDSKERVFDEIVEKPEE